MQNITPTHLMLFIITISIIGSVLGILAYFKVPKVNKGNEGNTLNDAYLYKVWGSDKNINNN